MSWTDWLIEKSDFWQFRRKHGPDGETLDECGVYTYDPQPDITAWELAQLQVPIYAWLTFGHLVERKADVQTNPEAAIFRKHFRMLDVELTAWPLLGDRLERFTRPAGSSG